MKLKLISNIYKSGFLFGFFFFLIYLSGADPRLILGCCKILQKKKLNIEMM